MKKLSVVLATRNEEQNIARCLGAIANIADEIIIVDEHSTDKTREIAKKYGAKVFLEEHHDIFHITKQKALDKASGEWVLQLDADEVVTPELAAEIKKIISAEASTLASLEISDNKKARLFKKHQESVFKRDGTASNTDGEVNGFFIARENIFLGKPLIHAGVYPDGVVRLVRNGYASFPQKSVHEQISVKGQIKWLENDLEHYDSPTFFRYIERANRYTDLTAAEMQKINVSKNTFSFIKYAIFKPIQIFASLYLFHRGFLDGPPGFIWSVFSGLHFPLAYFKYITNET